LTEETVQDIPLIQTIELPLIGAMAKLLGGSLKR
jgi:hypothetical protein